MHAALIILPFLFGNVKRKNGYKIGRFCLFVYNGLYYNMVTNSEKCEPFSLISV
ncbi:hypothetical protein Cst_c10250 [Thermoclostridium stercorarium subsp. stercorarium DSM 8532]|uniref:Uncharacterized protein n=1 Tax=Thermoclostridium stercorarium (strain ATCC 35414 / DSM 8532 / NCIMB 11754) TaxID=1121335 RepID=L7VR17_THES1|nr:hypothetical protein Cst_c10250 [Thermoclostridium stercorarium subsp. stercorarium DSM 8532]